MHERFRFVIFAACLLFLLSPSPNISYSASTADKYTDGNDVSPIKVSASINSVLRSSTVFDANVVLETQLDSTSSKSLQENIDLSYSIYKLSETGDGTIKGLIKDKFIATRNLTLKQKSSSSFKMEMLKEGQYQLVVQALSELKDEERLGGREDIFFTIDSEGFHKGWKQPVSNIAYGLDEKGNTLKLVDVTDKNYGTEAVDSQQSEQANSMNTAAVQVSFTGSFKEYFRDYSSVIAVKSAKVELRYRDQFYIWRTIGSTTTDGVGNFSFTYDTPSGANLWEVRLTAQNVYGKIIDQNGSAWSVVIQYSDLSTGGNIGNSYIANYSAAQKAFWLYNDIVITHNSLLPYRDPGSATIEWYPSSTESARYILGGNVLLNAASAQSKTTAIHELAHNYMYNIYNGDYPTFNCSVGHYYNTQSEAGCAWTEGWAHFLALNMNSSPIYTYTDGTQWNAENTSSFASGDKVEGRVAGALWDLRDTVNDGTDIRGYLFKNIYEVMYGSKVSTFADYWSKWKAKGFDINAKESIAQNSIYYQ